MPRVCRECGKSSDAADSCPNCGAPMGATGVSVLPASPAGAIARPTSVRSDEAPAGAATELTEILRRVWADGALEEGEAEDLEKARLRLGVDGDLFLALDLAVRRELGLLGDDETACPLELEVGLDSPAIRDRIFSLDVRVRNRSDAALASVTLRLDSPCFEARGGLEEFSLRPGERLTLEPDFFATQPHSSGAPIRLVAEVVDAAGVPRVYKPEESLRIPVLASPDEREPGMKIFLNSASGGLARADFDKLPPTLIRELHLTATDGGASRLDADCLESLKKALPDGPAIRAGGKGMIPVRLRLDRRGTEALERRRGGGRTDRATTVAGGAPTDLAVLEILEDGARRRIHLTGRPVAVFGRPLGEADMWLGVWDKNGKPDPERTGRISSRHFAVKCDGNEVLVRDLGSANGTWLNGKRLGDEWRPLRHRDRLEPARGLIVLRALLEEAADASQGRYVNIRLAREGDVREDFALLPAGGALAVGSSPDCPIRIAAATALNARITRERERYWLRNVDSAGNVAVDGAPLARDSAVPLANGLNIRVGGAAITVYVPAGS